MHRVARVDRLTIFGLFAVSAMLVTYALEKRSSWFILAFAGACLLGSAYGFLQGAWPFGLVEAIWAVVAGRRWWKTRLRAVMESNSRRPDWREASESGSQTRDR